MLDIRRHNCFPVLVSPISTTLLLFSVISEISVLLFLVSHISSALLLLSIISKVFKYKVFNSCLSGNNCRSTVKYTKKQYLLEIHHAYLVPRLYNVTWKYETKYFYKIVKNGISWLMNSIHVQIHIVVTTKSSSFSWKTGSSCLVCMLVTITLPWQDNILWYLHHFPVSCLGIPVLFILSVWILLVSSYFLFFLSRYSRLSS